MTRISSKIARWFSPEASRHLRRPPNPMHRYRIPIALLLLATILSSIPLLYQTVTAGGTVTGAVFQDYNNNGTRDTSFTLPNDGGGTFGVALDRGISGVAVTAYNAAGTVAGTATSAPDGTYTLTLLGTGPYRLEFTGLPNDFQPGPQGTNNGSTIRFVPEGGAVGVDLGVGRPDEYCQNNPDLVTSCYTYGNQFGPQPNPVNPVLPPVDFSNDPVIVSFPYSAGSNSAAIANWDVPTAHALAVPARLVGPTFGLAYGRTPRRIFAAAIMKKHSGFGPGGPGAIYRIDRATGAIEATYTVPGAVTNAHDPNPNNFVTDNLNIAWDAVGKTSLGGMDITDDDTRLFVMNLENRTLYAIEALSGVVLASQPVPIANVPLVAPSPAPFCDPDDVRPFAVEYNRGSLYAGVVCSAESTPTVDTFVDGTNGCPAQGAFDVAYNDTLVGGPTNCLGETFVDGDGNTIYNIGDTRQLQALIYRVNPVTLAFDPTPAFQFPLNYPRGIGAAEPDITTVVNGRWRPWINGFRAEPPLPNPNNSTPNYPQPVLTDLELDSTGNLFIAIRDRYGEQMGNGGYSDPAAPGRPYAGATVGELLLACVSGAGWVLENNGSCGGNTTAGAGNGQGPGGGEYFFRDEYNPYHDEVMLGGILQMPGFPDVVAAALDPFPGPNEVFDAGFRWYNDTNGTLTKGYRLFNGDPNNPFTFGKAGGLGDVIALCESAPIEIGNRVWYDADRDGIQDPEETPLAGVTVELFDPVTGVVIGTGVTDATGNYYFSSAPGASTSSALYDLPIQYGQAYQIRIPTTQPAIVDPQYALTVANTGGGGNPDLNDSDGTQSGAYAVYDFTTGQPGQNNHTYDFGFSLAPTAVTLTHFSAAPEAGVMTVRWTTSAEVNTWGFQLYRSTSSKRADAQLITPQVIPAQGRGQGASYSWTDPTAPPGATYTYWLVETEVGGATNEYGPITASAGLSQEGHRGYLPVIIR